MTTERLSNKRITELRETATQVSAISLDARMPIDARELQALLSQLTAAESSLARYVVERTRFGDAMAAAAVPAVVSSVMKELTADSDNQAREAEAKLAAVLAAHELERLGSIARAATAGPRDCDGFADGDYARLVLYSGNNQGPAIAEGITSQEDARFLVTFDRETVLALIDQQNTCSGRTEQAELDLEDLEEAANHAASGPRMYHWSSVPGTDYITLHSRTILGPVIADKITALSDAVFFAVFDRSTVLDLIAGVRAAREKESEAAIKQVRIALDNGVVSADDLRRELEGVEL